MKRTKKTIGKHAYLLQIKNDYCIKLVSGWSEFHVKEIKKIPARKYNPIKKYWTIPCTLENCFLIKKLGYVFADGLKKWAYYEWKDNEDTDTPIEIKGLKGKPFAFQYSGVRKIEKFNGRALLADDMGLGKTIQCLMYLQIHMDDCLPCFIICPASLKWNWQKECIKWVDNPSIQILEGEKPKPITKAINIINYDILKNWETEIIKINPSLIIIDEVQKIKNSSTIRYKSCYHISQKAKYIIQASGTPIEKSPIEFYAPLQLLNKNLFPNIWSYRHKYCDAKHNGYAWDFSGASNTRELYDILIKKAMIRRRKEDVLKFLPEQTISYVPIPIDNKREYDMAEKNYKKYVKQKAISEIENMVDSVTNSQFSTIVSVDDTKIKEYIDGKLDKANHLTQMNILKKLSAEGKLRFVLKWIKTFLESGEKLVVFCEHVAIAEAIHDCFLKTSVMVHGGISSKNRNVAVEQFQNNDKINLFIGNSAAQEGLTLTASSNIAHVEFPWNPGPFKQRNDRVRRIGTKYPVTVYLLMGIGTIDEKICGIIDSKQNILDQLLEGNFDNKMIIKEVIKKYYGY